MKKIFITFGLSLLFTVAVKVIPSFAYTTLIFKDFSDYYDYYIFAESPDVVVIDYNDYRGKFYYNGYLCAGQGAFTSLDDASYAATEMLRYADQFEPYSSNALIDVDNPNNIWVHGPYQSQYEFDDQLDPSPPEPGSDWLSSVWEWFLWQLGLNDDYSGDIDAYITGGDREPFSMVTPSPTPSPTPVPTPTPYTLDIVDNNGNPVYTITGIPGSTYNITNTTNNNDGSDFDIFEVDIQIGDGGSTNPRDGLNDVMDTSLTYLSDPENVDMQPVGYSFSIIPNDWFLLLGVIACFPFIAGFISKLLK